MGRLANIKSLNSLLDNGFDYDDIQNLLNGQTDKLKDLISALNGNLVTSGSTSGGTSSAHADPWRAKLMEDLLNDLTDINREYDKQLSSVTSNLEMHEKLKSIVEELSGEYTAIGQTTQFITKERREGLTLEEEINKLLLKQNINVRRLNNGWGEIKRGFNEIKRTCTELLNNWGKLDEAASTYAKHIGQSAVSYENMRKTVLDNHKLLNDYNLSSSELIKLNETYNDNIGRKTIFSTEQHSSIAGMNLLMGGDKTQTVIDSFDKFGLGVADAQKRMSDIFVKSTRHGVAFSKYSKNFLDNIKMAQTYTFKDGVKSIERMAEKATALRFNMQETGKFIEKISTLEGALTSSANLSVLGGSFSSYANPMQMLYEGLQDGEAAQERIMNMFSNFASLNNQTGELEVTAFNKQRIKAASEAAGLDYNQMMDYVYAQGRRRVIGNQIQGYNEGSDEYEAIVNQSYIKDGKAYVTGENGKEISVEEIGAGDINYLTEKNRIQDGSEIKDIVLQLRSLKDIQEGLQKRFEDYTNYIIENLNIGDTTKMIISSISNILAGGYVGVKLWQIAYNTGKMLNGFSTLTNGRVAPSQGVGTAPAGGNFWNKFTTNKWGGRGYFGKNITGWSRAALIGGGLASLGGALVGGRMQDKAEENEANGKYDGGTWGMHVGGSALKYAGYGAALGGFLGPWGMAIGGALGGAYGLISGWTDANDKQYRNIIKSKTGVLLRGKYSNSDLEGLAGENGRQYFDSHPELQSDIQEKDPEAYPILATRNYRSGGVVTGIGTGTSDSNIARVSRGEYIMPEAQVSKAGNRDILDHMRNGGSFIGSFKDGGNVGETVKPSGNTMKIMKVEKSENSKSVGASKIEFGNFNIGGTIKLELNGDSKSLNVNELIDKEKLFNEIKTKLLENDKFTDSIAKNMKVRKEFGYNKKEFYSPFTA